MSQRWGSASPDSSDWPTYNEPLVVRGEFFLELSLFETWDEELERLNRGSRRGSSGSPPPSSDDW